MDPYADRVAEEVLQRLLRGPDVSGRSPEPNASHLLPLVVQDELRPLRTAVVVSLCKQEAECWD